MLPNLPSAGTRLAPDTSALSLAPDGTDLTDCAASEPRPPDIDLSSLELAPAGADVLERAVPRPARQAHAGHGPPGARGLTACAVAPASAVGTANFRASPESTHDANQQEMIDDSALSALASLSPSLLRRLAALLYDILLVLPLIMACVALVMGVRTLLGLGPAADGTVQLEPLLVQALALLTTMVFFGWFWLRNGQTLGMQAWRIKLLSFAGTSPNVRQVADPLPRRGAVRRLPGPWLPVVPGRSARPLLARLAFWYRIAPVARQAIAQGQKSSTICRS